MLEPLPSPVPDEFLPVQLVAVGYVLSALVLTAILVALWLPIRLAVPAFVVVAAGLLLPFWTLVRRYYPERTDG